MISFLLVLLAIVLTLASSFISLSQIALFSLPSSLTTHYRKSDCSRKKMIAGLLAHPHHLLMTLIFCDIGVNIGVQNAIAILFESESLWILNVGLPLVLTLILGEILPKAVAIPYNTRISYAIAPCIKVIKKICNPFLNWLIVGISSSINFFLPPKNSEHISPKELKDVLQSCKNFGLVSQEEGKLIYGYLSLNDCIVRERMQPRHEILFYDINSPVSDLYKLFKIKQCSRVPVCNGDVQNLLGICSAKLLLIDQSSIKTGSELIPLLKKPYYMTETISAKSALCHLIAEGETMGIIIDEYGSIEGLITQEDLFEIVIGEVIDKRDEKILYTRSSKDVIIAAGKMELIELQEIFNIELPTKNNVVTIGGWLTEQLGTIPSTGTTFEWKNLLFQILDAAPHKIRRIYIRKLHV